MIIAGRRRASTPGHRRLARQFAEETGIPVGETQAGKGALPYDHPQMVDALGASGSAFANELASQADLVIGIGTRYTDFTTASKTMFRPDVHFININVDRTRPVQALCARADRRRSRDARSAGRAAR